MPKKSAYVYHKQEKIDLRTGERIAAEPRRRGKEEGSVERSNHEERGHQINAANHKGDPLEGTTAFAASAPRPLSRADPRHNPVVAFAYTVVS